MSLYFGSAKAELHMLANNARNIFSPGRDKTRARRIGPLACAYSDVAFGTAQSLADGLARRHVLFSAKGGATRGGSNEESLGEGEINRRIEEFAQINSGVDVQYHSMRMLKTALRKILETEQDAHGISFRVVPNNQNRFRVQVLRKETSIAVMEIYYSEISRMKSIPHMWEVWGRCGLQEDTLAMVKRALGIRE